MTDKSAETPTIASAAGFDILNSSALGKENGFKRLNDSLPELKQAVVNTDEMLQLIHYIVTPNITKSDLPQQISDDMHLGLMLLDRPDIDRYHHIAIDLFEKFVKKGKYKKNTRLLFTDLRNRVSKEMAKFTQINFNPTLKGGLRSYGSRKIDGFDEEPTVYANHNLVMASETQMLALQFGQPGMIYPDSYYGLSTGLNMVYTKLCNKYDLMEPNTFQLKDILLKESFFQVLGTRLLHPFWDGNGRAFTGQLFFSLNKLGIKTEIPKLLNASIKLGHIGDTIVETMLKESKLSLVSDIKGFPGTLMMWFNPFVRADYMQKLKTGLETAIDTADKPDSPYHHLLLRGANIIEKAIT